MKTNIGLVKKRNWGEGCEAWELFQNSELSIKEERMPPGTSEQKHFHKTAQQFFYVLSGKAEFHIENKTELINDREGIYIPNSKFHFLKNVGAEVLEFLVVSNPDTEGDRFETLDQDSLNLNNKKFKGISNSSTGEVSAKTIFHYRQKNDIIWATYEGGDILFGTLSGKRIKNTLEFNYQHQNTQGELLTGHCLSKVELNEQGKIQLLEKWQWTCREHSKGESILEEVSIET